MKILNILILFFAIHCASFVNGQDISVKAAFDTSKIYIGDQINFSITIDQPAGIEVSLPSFSDTLSNKLEILAGPVTDSTVIQDNRLRISTKYLVTSFDSGMYFVKPVYAEFKDESGIKRYFSDYSILEVTRVKMTPPDTASKIFDIVGPYRAPVTPGELLPWLFLALVIGVVAWLIYRYAGRFRKKQDEVELPVIAEPAHVVAFRELEKLKGEKLWQAGEIKKYYTRLTEILRQYLENRYRVFSLELTTSETLDALVKTGFRKDETYNILKSVLNEADLVKFAKYKPEPAENELSFDKAWDFIAKTRAEEVKVVQAEVEEKGKEVAV